VPGAAFGLGWMTNDASFFRSHIGATNIGSEVVLITIGCS